MIIYAKKKNKLDRFNDENMIMTDELYEKIKIQLDKCNYDDNGVFVKTSLKSGKYMYNSKVISMLYCM